MLSPPVSVPQSAARVNIELDGDESVECSRVQVIFDGHGIIYSDGSGQTWWPWRRVRSLWWSVL